MTAHYREPEGPEAEAEAARVRAEAAAIKAANLERRRRQGHANAHAGDGVRAIYGAAYHGAKRWNRRVYG